MRLFIIAAAIALGRPLGAASQTFDEDAKCAACGAVFQELYFNTLAEKEWDRKQDPDLRLVELLHESGPEKEGVCMQLKEYYVVAKGLENGKSAVRRPGQGPISVSGHADFRAMRDSREEDRLRLVHFCNRLVEEYEETAIADFLREGKPVFDLAEEICVRRRAHCTLPEFRTLQSEKAAIRPSAGASVIKGKREGKSATPREAKKNKKR